VTFFSVVIPVYNRYEQLEVALDSVRNQSFKDFEIIVIDDGSDNNEKIQAICTKFGAKYKAIRHSGISVARNAGTSQAEGKYIVVLDSDDAMLPDRLMITKQAIDLSKADWIYGDSLGASEIGGFREFNSRAISLERLMTGETTHVSWAVKKDTLEKVGGYDKRPKVNYRGGDDFELSLRLYKAGTSSFCIDLPLTWRTLVGNDRITKTNLMKRYAIVKELRIDFLKKLGHRQRFKVLENIGINEGVKKRQEKLGNVISVISTVYKDRIKDVKRFIEFYDKEEYPFFEVVLVSDVPIEFRRDWLINIISDYPDQPRASMKNDALKLCSGDLILFQDIDVFPENLQAIIQSTKRFPERGIIHSKISQKKDGSWGTTDDEWRLKKISNNEPVWKLMGGGTFSIPRDLITVKWDERFDGAWGLEDNDFGLQLSEKGVNLVYDEKSVFRHYWHPEKRDISNNLKKFERKWGCV